MFIDYVIYVWKHLSRRKLRSWLTLLGIFIGMAAVVALISTSQGLEDAILEQFSSVGADRIMIMPAGAIAGPFSSSLTAVKLTEDDVDVIRKIKGVEFTEGFTASTVPMQFKGESITAYVLGVPVNPTTEYYIERIGFWDLEEGRNPKSPSEIAVGALLVDAYSKNISLRSKVEMYDSEFTVVGIGKRTGSFSDQAVRLDRGKAREIFNIPEGEVAMIVVKVNDGQNAAEVAKVIQKDLRRFRGVDEGEEDFSVQTSEDIIKSLMNILGIVQALLVGVAAISLVVGGVGIMNTMYTAITERTREIGIMKAIGAKNKDIMTIFLLESGGLGLAGGVIGVALGLGISKVVEIVAAESLGTNLLQAHVSWQLILGVLVFAFSLGALSGYFPARKGAKMLPVDALRH